MAVPVQAFATKYRSSLKTRLGDAFRINFQQDGYQGAIETGPDVTQLVVSYGSRNRFHGIIQSTLNFSVWDPDLALGNEITAAGEREWRIQVEVVEGPVRFNLWRGYLVPETIEQPIGKFGRSVGLQATDGTAYLSDLTYNGPIEGRISVSDLLYRAAECIDPALSEVLVNSQVRPFVSGTPITREALSTLYVDASVLENRKWGSIIQDEVLARFGLIMTYHHPLVEVFDPLSFDGASYPLTRIVSGGGREIDPDRIITPIAEADYEFLEGVGREFIPAVSDAEIAWEHGYDESSIAYGDNLLANGDFEEALAGGNWAIGDPFDRIANPDGDGYVLDTSDPLTGSDIPAVYASQDVEVPAGDAYFGMRFTAEARWYIAGVTDPAAVTNTRVDWALRFTGASGSVTWWNHTSREWQSAEIANQFAPAGLFVPLAVDASRLSERGTVQVRLYEGVDARIGGQPGIESYHWDNASVAVAGASGGQSVAQTTRVVNTGVHVSPVIARPDRGAFLYGSDEAVNVKYRRALTTSAASSLNARGFKRGDYSVGEASTGHTLDEYLGRQFLHLGAGASARLNAELKVFSADLFVPVLPLEYDGDNYLMVRVRHDLIGRRVRVIARRISVGAVAEADISTAVIESEQRGAVVSGGGGGGVSAAPGGPGGTAYTASSPIAISDTNDISLIFADNDFFIAGPLGLNVRIATDFGLAFAHDSQSNPIGLTVKILNHNTRFGGLFFDLGAISIKLTDDSGLELAGNLFSDAADKGLRLDAAYRLPQAGGGFLQRLSGVYSLVSGLLMTLAERNKLGAIEALATADQTAAEIRTLLGQATETQLGLSQVATTANTTGGNNDWKFLTPLKLKERLGTFIRNATTTVRGFLMLSNNTQGLAGTDTQRAVPPSVLKYVLDSRLTPNPPTSLSADNETGSSIDVSWNAPTSGATVTGYRIEWRTGSGAYETANVAADTTEFTITGLDADSSYDIRVRSTGGVSSSTYATTTASTLNVISQTFTIGTANEASASSLNWSNLSTQQINANLLAEGGTAFLRNVYLSSNNPIRIQASSSDSGSGFDTGPELVPGWETYAEALIVEAGGLSLTLEGPNNPNSILQDAAEPYSWDASTGKRAETGTFITAYLALSAAEKAATTLTLQYEP